MSELSIKVVIGGRTYPLTINREDEEKIRKSVSEIENNIKNLKENYAVNDMQDLLAMTALEYANDSVTKNNSVEFEKLSKEIIMNNNIRQVREVLVVKIH
jgi:cell division protein ZapA